MFPSLDNIPSSPPKLQKSIINYNVMLNLPVIIYVMGVHSQGEEYSGEEEYHRRLQEKKSKTPLGSEEG